MALNSYQGPIGRFILSHPHPWRLHCTSVTPTEPRHSPKWPKTTLWNCGGSLVLPRSNLLLSHPRPDSTGFLNMQNDWLLTRTRNSIHAEFYHKTRCVKCLPFFLLGGFFNQELGFSIKNWVFFSLSNSFSWCLVRNQVKHFTVNIFEDPCVHTIFLS